MAYADHGRGDATQTADQDNPMANVMLTDTVTNFPRVRTTKSILRNISPRTGSYDSSPFTHGSSRAPATRTRVNSSTSQGTPKTKPRSPNGLGKKGAPSCRTDPTLWTRTPEVHSSKVPG